MSIDHEMSYDAAPAAGQMAETETLAAPCLADRLRGILEDRDTALQKRRALLDDPRIGRLLETGQSDIASNLAGQRATGSTELPPIKTSRGGQSRRARSYNEGSDSEHDAHWNAPAPSRTPEVAASGRLAATATAEAQRQSNALAQFREDTDRLGVDQALAALRAKGYIPDSSTHGSTLIKVSDPHQPFARRRPQRPRS